MLTGAELGEFWYMYQLSLSFALRTIASKAVKEPELVANIPTPAHRVVEVVGTFVTYDCQAIEVGERAENPMLY